MIRRNPRVPNQSVHDFAQRFLPATDVETIAVNPLRWPSHAIRFRQRAVFVEISSLGMIDIRLNSLKLH